MVMAVDLTASAVPLAGLAEKLQALGDSMGISIRIQRQEIFDAMHRI
jgi:ACT domain-containing protein